MGAIDLTSRPLAAIPMALAELHRTTRPGERRRIRLPEALDPVRRSDTATGAGLLIVRGAESKVTTVERVWSLPDTVAANMHVLISGLNPSPAAADAGIGFARPGNRFWPAAMAAGLVGRDRDPDHALYVHGVGMTDIVKRTTRRAAELDVAEYTEGLDRLDRLAGWLRPEAVCFVGLSGWRAAVARRASTGWQNRPLGESPVYVMPSTSGLNASSQLPDFVAHLRVLKRGR